MNEFDFIRNYLCRQNNTDGTLIHAIGDDAAVLRPQAGLDWHISSDMLLAGRHFFADTAPADLAHKVLAVNLSDMAAMGAAPRYVLLCAALPELNESWLNAFCGQFFALAEEYGVRLIGGDTTRGDYVFSVTVIGQTQQGQALLRSGAQTGDDIWVSGSLGAAAAALHHHWQKVRLPEELFRRCEVRRLRPTPRVALGRALLPFAHAAQDISDGLLQDLGHILAASGKGAQICADDVPAPDGLAAFAGYFPWILAGGDDYELVFTAAPQDAPQVRRAAADSGTAVTKIGTITAASGCLNVTRRDGSALDLPQKGFDHFAQ